MSTEDLENYETDMELQLYREYKDIAAQFSYVNVRGALVRQTESDDDWERVADVG